MAAAAKKLRFERVRFQVPSSRQTSGFLTEAPFAQLTMLNLQPYNKPA
jgi:hypothetical protein